LLGLSVYLISVEQINNLKQAGLPIQRFEGRNGSALRAFWHLLLKAFGFFPAFVPQHPSSVFLADEALPMQVVDGPADGGPICAQELGKGADGLEGIIAP
jgi:hypothetical protein